MTAYTKTLELINAYRYCCPQEYLADQMHMSVQYILIYFYLVTLFTFRVKRFETVEMIFDVLSLTSLK